VKDIHQNFLLEAHLLAKKQFGKTFPNPSVGCLIVKNGRIIAKSVTASAGRPHAEEIALKKIGNKSIGSTMYVTLEPCSHDSLNGSCADQIINSGIKKIIIAKIDPDKRTNGKSIKKFKKNKLITVVGKTSKETYKLNKFFFESLKLRRPFIKVKMASTSDQKIARKDYSSKWISNKASRNYAHKLRFESQAILTTSKTIIKDDPRFTIRKKNKIIRYMPVIIIDRFLNTPMNSKILKNISKRRVIIFTQVRNKKIIELKKIGCEVFFIKLNSKKLFNLKEIMKKVFNLNINNILVEAGGILFTNLLSNNLVNEIHLFTSVKKFGAEGKPLLVKKSFKNIKLKLTFERNFGKDIYRYYSLGN